MLPEENNKKAKTFFSWLSEQVGEGIARGISLVLVAVVLIVVGLIIANALGYNVSKINVGPIELAPNSTVTVVVNSVAPVSQPQPNAQVQENVACPAMQTEFPMYPGMTYTDTLYNSGHTFYYDNYGDISIGVTDTEQVVSVSTLYEGEWVLEHRFQNIGYGAFYMCIDSTGQLYGAIQ